ncbi:MAG: hypothetical protein ACE5GS_09160 [Kiloniellaceae bacterium]
MKGCRNCTHWQPLGEYLDRVDPATAGHKAQLGLCRRYAPRPVAARADGAEIRWPRVVSDDWCGEWDPRFE